MLCQESPDDGLLRQSVETGNLWNEFVFALHQAPVDTLTGESQQLECPSQFIVPVFRQDEAGRYCGPEGKESVRGVWGVRLTSRVIGEEFLRLPSRRRPEVGGGRFLAWPEPLLAASVFSPAKSPHFSIARPSPCSPAQRLPLHRRISDVSLRVHVRRPLPDRFHR